MDVTGFSVDSLDSQAIDVLPVAVCICDRDGRIVRANPRAVDLWGRAPTANDLHDSPLAQVLRTGQPVRDAPLVVQRRDGSSIPVRVTITPITDARGSLIAAVSTLIEDRADADADLDRARLAAIVVSSDDAIVSKTLDGDDHSPGTSAPSACSATPPTRRSGSTSR